MVYQKTNDQYIKEATVIHGDKYDYSNTVYTKASENVIIGCKVEGHGNFLINAGNHIDKKRQAGCQKCAFTKSAKIRGDKRRFTNDQFITKSKLKFPNKFDYSDTNYTGSNNDVILRCIAHNNTFETNAGAHFQMMFGGCLPCASEHMSKLKSSNTMEFVEKALKVHGDKYDYSNVDYVNSTTAVTIGCPEHNDFYQKPADHLAGYGCFHCGLVLMHQAQAYTTDHFVNLSSSMFPGKFDYTDTIYYNSLTELTIRCILHDYTFKTVPKTHFKSEYGCCRMCVLDVISRSPQQFIIEAKVVHGDLYDYSKCIYVDTRTKVIIICREHGEFLQSPHGHLQGYGCVKCSSLKNEKLCRTIIEKLTGLIFHKVRPKFLMKLEYDCYNEVLKLAIEYNGEQHYEFVPFLQKTEAKFKRQQENDARKVQLSIENGIYLIVVPYYVQDKEKFITDHYNNYLFLNSFNTI